MIADLVRTLTGEELLTKNTDGSQVPTQDQIARLAYHFYEARGRHDGRDLDDWLAAEQQLTHHFR